MYCYNRADLPNSLIHLIEVRLKKLLDLNQMRGLYLAAVADFDHFIDNIIHTTFDKMECENLKEEAVGHIFNNVLSFHEKQVEKIKKLSKDGHINTYTDLISSNPKITLLIKMLNDLDDEQLYAHIESLSKYTEDIIVPRNKLAHSMEVECKQGKYILKNSSRESEFTLDDFLTLRHKVLDYKDTFESIGKFI
ncbi:hypothetical protein RS130_10305 [Paraglaciecola aquimarina]|uniref:RiboL-PSP-HEPN domain-containing protein n=1 Tax=Paraglaciecola aquimarina TaxID=1235557 RepID=A0ABU3SW73_9ALTE|nr:hypothetical protein [Paraglaciecola aquimarina]MDU0354270.1 hypothetical protein [Paraglaciecola aquimarina]